MTWGGRLARLARVGSAHRVKGRGNVNWNMPERSQRVRLSTRAMPLNKVFLCNKFMNITKLFKGEVILSLIELVNKYYFYR